MLDFTSSSSILGKPALNDLASGLATAPVLFAAEDYPVSRPPINPVQTQRYADWLIVGQLPFNDSKTKVVVAVVVEQVTFAWQNILKLCGLVLFYKRCGSVKSE